MGELEGFILLGEKTWTCLNKDYCLMGRGLKKRWRGKYGEMPGCRGGSLAVGGECLAVGGECLAVGEEVKADILESEII